MLNWESGTHARSCCAVSASLLRSTEDFEKRQRILLCSSPILQPALKTKLPRNDNQSWPQALRCSYTKGMHKKPPSPHTSIRRLCAGFDKESRRRQKFFSELVSRRVCRAMIQRELGLPLHTPRIAAVGVVTTLRSTPAGCVGTPERTVMESVRPRSAMQITACRWTTVMSRTLPKVSLPR